MPVANMTFQMKVVNTMKKETTAEELVEFLRSLGIKEEGIQIVNEVHSDPYVKYHFLRILKIILNSDELRPETPKEAVKQAWMSTRLVLWQWDEKEKMVRRPTTEDLQKL